MPSFFESLRRVVTGEPMFRADERAPQQPSAPQKPVVRQGPKVLPLVTIGRTQCRNNGGHMECELVIQNRSQQNVRLQRIELLGITDELGEFLQPGGEREYSFNVAPLTSTQQNQAKLFYLNDGGDYFCSVHLVNFEKMSDGTYWVKDFRFMSPVRDV